MATSGDNKMEPLYINFLASSACLLAFLLVRYLKAIQTFSICFFLRLPTLAELFKFSQFFLMFINFILFSGGPTSGSPRLHVEAQAASVQSPGSPISIQLALHRRGRPGSHLALATSTR